MNASNQKQQEILFWKIFLRGRSSSKRANSGEDNIFWFLELHGLVSVVEFQPVSYKFYLSMSGFNQGCSNPFVAIREETLILDQ